MNRLFQPVPEVPAMRRCPASPADEHTRLQEGIPKDFGQLWVLATA